MTASRGAHDVIDVLVAEHRALGAQCLRLDTGGSAPKGRTEPAGQVVTQLLTALVRHMAAEEACLYPWIRAVVPQGDLITDREIAEHADAVKLIDELATLHVRHWLFAPTFNTLVCHVRSHFAEEEARVFPALAGVLARPALLELGALLSKAGRIISDHPVRLAPTADDIRAMAEAVRTGSAIT